MQPKTFEAIVAQPNTSIVLSEPITADWLMYGTAQAWFSANDAAGSLKLQVSNDVQPDNANGHWNDVPNTSASVATGSTTMTPVPAAPIAAKWVRVAFDSSGGTGTVSAMFHGWGY